MTTVVSMRVTKADHRRLAQLACVDEDTVQQFVRDAVSEYLMSIGQAPLEVVPLRRSPDLNTRSGWLGAGGARTVVAGGVAHRRCV